ncbi:intein N-terminal splicing region [Orenia metallireducens]|uniref:Intein N-terminal splicing region n=1 Tax=Orenia metallireducens TaxID=1413210 RepID=A0A285FW08_9FIRM|nr:glycosyltransferase [Orenia metallireducens]SNY15328.1 intein N-terminal splicing region [Orenia metallireducens]
MKNIKFSVLLSVYFRENPDYLKKSLNSIIDQTVKPDEIVLVKDGELTKELDEVIDEFISKYTALFKVITFNENRGLGIALYEGVKACSYDIIARMDTDDIAKKDRFEKQINIFKERLDIDLVGSWIDEFELETNNVISQRRVPKTNKEIIKFAKQRCPFNHPTVMYRKESVLNSGNYQEFLWNEDYYLWVRMLVNGCEMYNIQESLLYFRTGKDMFKRRGGLRYALQDIMLQKEFLKLGFVNIFEFLYNILIRTSIRLIPNNLRGLFYKKFLREGGEKVEY